MTRQVKTYNPNHIFVDTNVLIGAYSGDARFQTDCDCLHYLYSIVGKRLYASTLSVAQLISVYQKKKTNDEIRSIVRELQHRFTIVSFTAKDIDEALTENGADIEDNVQFVLARKQKCRVIITNNYKDYRLLLGAQIIKPSKVRTIAR
jgi:predicted nucleic acid-binding protein